MPPRPAPAAKKVPAAKYATAPPAPSPTWLRYLILSLTALAVIAILALVLHVASTELLNRSHADPDAAAPGGEATCPADAKPPELSLPFD